MTVQELIDALEQMDPDAEVQLATQPNYPLAYYLAGAVHSSDLEQSEEEMAEDNWQGRSDSEDTPGVCWLAQGSHTEDPYGVPSGVWR